MRFGFCLLPTLLIGMLIGVSTSLAQHDHEEDTKLTPRKTDSQRSSVQQEGLHENPPRRVAIVGATIHRTPLSQPNIETILINGTKIVAIGVDLPLPPGTKTIDGRGKHCYPGFIDAYVGHEFKLPAKQGTSYWNENVRSELQVSQRLNPDDLKMQDWRAAGFTAVLVAPSEGIVKGQSSLVLLSDYETEHLLLADRVAQHIELTKSRGSGVAGYPNSPMGAVALARQAMYDAQWYQKAWQVAHADLSVERPEVNASLTALANVIDGSQMVMVETSNELFALRADRFAREFGLKLAIIGSGNEYRRLDDVAALGRTIVLPLDFPKPPDVSSAENAADASLEDMMHWDHAPANPGLLAAKDVQFVFTTKGIEKKADFLKQLRLAVKRGLSQNKALGALTLDAAKLFGVEDQIGSLQKNMIANITITDGDLFDDKTRIVETWVDGVRFSNGDNRLRTVAGNWTLSGAGFSDYSLVVKSRGNKISGRIQLTSEVIAAAEKAAEQASADDPKDVTDEGQPESDPAKKENGIEVKPISLSATRLTGAFESDTFGQKGISLFSLLINKDGTGSGMVTFPNGETTPLAATLQKEKAPDADAEWDDLMFHDEIAHANGEHSGKEPGAIPKDSKPASFEVNYPLGAYGRAEPPAQPQTVLITNVTIWSLDDRGKIENGSLLFGDGKIQSVFEMGAELPEADVVIDGQNCHVTPGIIDCHSHMATDSGVNESGQANTAEVRIGDMIDPNDITIYRQLAGGVTAANILHGSANPIGGQNQVIKLRWGSGEQGMKFENAPLGIKFALGENVKQSNRSGPSSRYPQTRMGVEQLIDDSFRAAKDYRTAQQNWKRAGKGLPPRRDLELDAMLEIVEGRRWVHCHSYRQDEILALIRTLDQHEIQIGSFQHILEGYKVADQMAEHGAMASAFADWWAYKYEVKDAIPFAGALMHRAGVVVSFNSDDGELGRHLNQEAAKAVKYGGVPEIEALKFVTLNPARQLRIDDKVGSLEPGKDADLVLWSGHPLSNFSTVKQTWVDGRKYFDHDEDAQLQSQMKEMRLSLIQKILRSGEKMEPKNESNVDPAKLWPRYDEFCHEHGHHHDE